MIRRLFEKDIPFLKEKTSDKSTTSVKIKALARAYGTQNDFVAFYSDENGDIIICIQDYSATVRLNNAVSEEQLHELADFLQGNASEVMADFEIPMPKSYNIQIGYSYSGMLEGKPCTDINNNLKQCFDILKVIFTEWITEEIFEQWYTDMSHRIRHRVSKLYNKGNSTVTVYAKENDVLMLSQIATLPSGRKKGKALELIQYAVSDNMPFEKIMLDSLNEKSDSFYEHIGFKVNNKWYYYLNKK